MNYHTDIREIPALTQYIWIQSANIASASPPMSSEYVIFNDYELTSQFGQSENVSNIPVKRKDEQLETEFKKLAEQWKRETSFQSSLGEVFMNDAYQRIMAMGKEALPWILSDLRKTSSHWFYALEKIAGRDVAEGAATFSDARATWLEWGYRNNYI